MSCQYNLLFLFLCGFAALSVSTKTCGKDLLEGTSCILKLTTTNKEKPSEIKWVHDTNGTILRWKGGTVKDNPNGVSMEGDGSLRFASVSLKDTGKYKFTAFNADGAQIVKGEVDIKVYEKAPKPTVNIKCTNDGNATLSCDIGDRKYLTFSWYRENKPIQNDKKPQVFLSSTQVQENKPYSCEAHNPVSKDKSESITVSCEEVKKAVGETVSFRPDKPPPAPVTSITWKHISSSGTVKAIEWEDEVIYIPHPRFKGITTLDTKTGQMNITDLKVEHSGVYTIDISGKEQEQRFTLSVMERVPKPAIKIEKSNNTVVYLICEYSERIIWKNSTGGILTGSARQPKGELLVVTKEGNPGNFYTCSLQNAVSEETSDAVYERNLFEEPVPKPEIIKVETGNPGVVNLTCEYNETIIWKDSTGKTLKGSAISPKGESITVKKNGNPGIFYTCTLQNDASSKTSDPVYERDLFKEPVNEKDGIKGSNKGCVVAAVIPSITMISILILFL